MALAIGIVGVGFFSFYFMNQEEIDSNFIQNSLIVSPEQKLVYQYGIDEFGTEHSHAAIVVFVNGELVNFGHSKYQLLSKYMHFENNNPYLIHKHATGTPLEMLFLSLGIKVTTECMIINYYSENSDKRYCSDDANSLQFYVNGVPYLPNLSEYVFDHNDRILISYGDSDEISEQIEFLNSLKIFDIPKKTPRYPGDGITI